MCDLHRAQDRALRCHNILRKKQDQIDVVKRQLEALEEELRAISAREEDALESFAKSGCSQLCNVVTTQLPRELRDMIYRYLLPNREKRIDREYFRSTIDPVTKLHTYDLQRWRAVHHPEHFWDPEYVGQKFFQELAEKYYRTTGFMFGDDDGLIQRFLETDLLSIGCQPGDLVAKVEVYLCAITYDRSSCIGYFFGSPTKPEKMRAALDGLICLKGGSKIVVQFSTQGKDEDVRETQRATAVSVLRAPMQKLLSIGYQVELIIDRETRVSLEAEPESEMFTRP